MLNYERIHKEIFLYSIVQHQEGHSNKYFIKNNTPILQYDLSSYEDALLHEISHFCIAPINRLTKDNWGYKIEGMSLDKWYDLDNEVQVFALEHNLVKYFEGIPEKNSWKVLEFLDGWSNYKYFHKLNIGDMHRKTEAAFNHWLNIYTVEWFFTEWKKRNEYLNTMLTKELLTV